MRFVLSADLGHQQDPTAIVLVEQERKLVDPNLDTTPAWDRRPVKIRNTYVVRGIERLPLGTTYPDIVRHLSAKMKHPKIANEVQLIADATGVGLPVVEMMHEEGLAPVGIWITAGEAVTNADYGYRVPKKDLVTALQIVFQSSRIRIIKSLPLADVLVKELINFRPKPTDKGNMQYEAWRSTDHDDIVLALAQAIWWAEMTWPQATAIDEVAPMTEWNPLDI